MRVAAYVFVAVLANQAVAGPMGVPDTGQDRCANASNALVACTVDNSGPDAAYPGQDGRFGRDAKRTVDTLTRIGGGEAGFDYSKIANNGADLGPGVGLALGPKPSDWACTRDNITGLIWEVKVDDPSHLRHAGWIYSWYDSNDKTNGGNPGFASITALPTYSPWCKTDRRCDTEKFVADVNAQSLCGKSDWRMPSVRELLTLVHSGKLEGYIDQLYFPNTPREAFYHSDTSMAESPEYAMFVWHGASWWGRKDAYAVNVLSVRLVRGPRY